MKYVYGQRMKKQVSLWWIVLIAFDSLMIYSLWTNNYEPWLDLLFMLI